MMENCIKDACGFDDRRLIAVGLPMSTLLVTLMFFHEPIEKGEWKIVLGCIPVGFVHTAIFWFALRWVYAKVRFHYPNSNDIGMRMVWLFAAFVVIFLSLDFFFDAFFQYLSHESTAYDPEFVMAFISSLILAALVITLYEAISFNVQLQKAVAEKAALERQNIESQLEGLRNQVNPHFLFNSLNTLTYLIPESPEKAIGFVQKLSKVYRYVLESRDSKLIPLEEELEFLSAYVFLLKERFGDNLTVVIDLPKEKKGMAIVPLSLQMLFENAIKHNVISSDKPLNIKVAIKKNYLVVHNNLQLKKQVMHSTGVGLQNIIDRYRMMADLKVEVNSSEKTFEVGLPIIELNSQETTAP
jgi:sensor histidine kinase YesM